MRRTREGGGAGEATDRVIVLSRGIIRPSAGTTSLSLSLSLFIDRVPQAERYSGCVISSIRRSYPRTRILQITLLAFAPPYLRVALAPLSTLTTHPRLLLHRAPNVNEAREGGKTGGKKTTQCPLATFLDSAPPCSSPVNALITCRFIRSAGARARAMCVVGQYFPENGRPIKRS